jgi:hypothetical protein
MTTFSIRMTWKLDIIEWSLPEVWNEDEARVFWRLVCKNYDPDAVLIRRNESEVVA